MDEKVTESSALLLLVEVDPWGASSPGRVFIPRSGGEATPGGEERVEEGERVRDMWRRRAGVGGLNSRRSTSIQL